MESAHTGLVVHRLVFYCRAITAIAMPEFAGSAVRGAFFAALRRHVCTLHGAGRPGGEEWLAGCPACSLFAPVDSQAQRGKDIARPFAIVPPLCAGGPHPPGWEFSFGLTLFGSAISLFPYLLIAGQTMGRIGFGLRTQAPGRFEVQECWADDPFGGRRVRIMDSMTTELTAPPLPIDDQVIRDRAEALERRCTGPGAACRLAVRFLTPTRLISEGRLTTAPHFSILVRRVLRRLCDLADTVGVPAPTVEFERLVARAEEVRIVGGTMSWIDLQSFSKRIGRATPIGGLVGEAVYEGDIEPFLPWLLWGEIVQVGKDTTKGNGLYRVSVP